MVFGFVIFFGHSRASQFLLLEQEVSDKDMTKLCDSGHGVIIDCCYSDRYIDDSVSTKGITLNSAKKSETTTSFPSPNGSYRATSFVMALCARIDEFGSSRENIVQFLTALRNDTAQIGLDSGDDSDDIQNPQWVFESRALGRAHCSHMFSITEPPAASGKGKSKKGHIEMDMVARVDASFESLKLDGPRSTLDKDQDLKIVTKKKREQNSHTEHDCVRIDPTESQIGVSSRTGFRARRS